MVIKSEIGLCASFFCLGMVMSDCIPNPIIRTTICFASLTYNFLVGIEMWICNKK